MTIREMHYDLKIKLNRLDSQKYRDIEIPKIDWKLNEAQEFFVKMVAEPRVKNQFGFEIGQRTIDDIRNVVVDQKPSDYVIPTIFDDKSYIATLPVGYWFLVKTKIIASKGECKSILLYDSKPVQHDDNSESSMFNGSSFEWRSANYRFNNQGLRVFTDGTFSIDKVGFEYLMKPEPMWNATDWIGGTYTTLDGKVRTGTQDCKLSDNVHSEIVDIAVMLIAGDLNLPTYQLKQNKVRINN